MSPRRSGTAGFMFLMLFVLAAPRPAHADFWDFIFEMSGPQLIGARFDCDWALDGSVGDCHAAGFKVGSQFPTPKPRAWISVGGGVYTSTGKDTNNEYDAFSVHMLAFEPTINAFSSTNPRARVYHGAGFTYDFLFGRDFRRFDKAGLKFLPVGVIVGRLDIAYTFRLYPNGFTSDEFGFGPRVEGGDRPREGVHGVQFAIHW